ncbi:MAG TPA: SDR family NAD(P)-dependent oxidoreductase [Methylomirabilota bacterium]|nr:SDR family NAD(P)-dependent oxidoreductase [Methylomirabilota bacterium]
MRRRRQRFAGSVVFITGASSGIGAALSLEFAREGADVVLAARRRDRLESVAAGIGAIGRRAVVAPCDVTREGDLERAAAAGRAAFGKLDVVVANAGFGVTGILERLSLDDYRRQLETNVFGVLRTVYATLDDLKKSRGRLVVIGSVSGYIALAGSSPYSMSKFAVRALADSLGHELAEHGVSVTLISPGFVESEIRQVDNRGILRTEKPAPRIPAPMVMATPTAARKIVGAVARRRREVVITALGKVSVFLHRHAPGLLAQIIRRFAIKGRREPR